MKKQKYKFSTKKNIDDFLPIEISLLDKDQKDLLTSMEKSLNLLRKPKIVRLAMRIFGWKNKCFYVCGPPGRGKTMLLKAFFKTLPEKNRRWFQFSELMIFVTKKLAETRTINPIYRIAKDISLDSKFIMIDEVQTTDSGDAATAKALLQGLIRNGVLLLMTSNRTPDTLCVPKQMRDSFATTITFIKKNSIVFEMNGVCDYRKNDYKLGRTFLNSNNPESENIMSEIFKKIEAVEKIKPGKVNLGSNRFVNAKAIGKKAAIFDFEEICGSNLGSKDYIKIAQSFQCLLLCRVHQMSPRDQDKARRLGLLVDNLYSENKYLILSSDSEPEDLYPIGEMSFEFQRTISRLTEMRSAKYNKEINTILKEQKK